jgi:hypothetical protein
MGYLSTANVILAQLGGNRFRTMTGAHNFLGSEEEKSLSFKVGRNGKGVTHVKIVHDATDTYSMQFFKIRGMNSTTVKECQGVYASNLQEIFTEATGLDTHL